MLYLLISNKLFSIPSLVHSYLFWLCITGSKQPQDLLGKTVTYFVMITDSMSQELR